MKASATIALVLGLAALSCAAQTSFSPGAAANPNYPKRNPFYFEGKVTWELLGITVPQNEWEYVQRGIHNQDDLEKMPEAIADYRSALQTNNLGNNTCQIVTVSNPPGKLTPPPCMFTPRLRLGVLLMKTSPAEAVGLFQEVLKIDPLRLGVNELIGETLAEEARETSDPGERNALYAKAIAAFQAELALSPVTALYTQVTGDEANNAHVHWALAEVYRALGDNPNQAQALQNYLKATKWHSDTYPWRITLAQTRLSELAKVSIDPIRRPVVR